MAVPAKPPHTGTETQAMLALQQRAEEYEYEDPAESWVLLVQATRILDVRARKEKTLAMLNEAKNSHWTMDLLDANTMADEDVDYTGGEDRVAAFSQGSDYVTQEDKQAYLKRPLAPRPVDIPLEEDLTEPFGDRDE